MAQVRPIHVAMIELTTAESHGHRYWTYWKDPSTARNYEWSSWQRKSCI